MNIDREKVCSALNKISEVQLNIYTSTNILPNMSEEEKNIIFIFLMFYGVVEVKESEFKVKSNAARLFIKSLSEYIRVEKPLVSVWTDRRHAKTINPDTVFLSSNFLWVFEKARKEACKDQGNFKPVFDGKTVRAAIVRRSWWRKLYLMQYSEPVGKYQLVGGVKDENDITYDKALLRKMGEEIPELQGNEEILDHIFTSKREDEEIFLSDKLNVFVRYETRIYEVRYRKKITREALKALSKNRNNRWVTIKEIERKKAKDGKLIFDPSPTAIEKLKGLEPSINVKSFEIGDLLNMFLESTWMKVVLALITISGVTFSGLLNAIISEIKDFLGW